MRCFYVEFSYGRKAPAFSANVNAVSETDAKHQALVLAKMSGWNEQPKKTTIRSA